MYVACIHDMGECSIEHSDDLVKFMKLFGENGPQFMTVAVFLQVASSLWFTCSKCVVMVPVVTVWLMRNFVI